ncbi:MAG: DUF2892 domain-containing protein [Anaerolineales bacterium]|nr:DUF2892 domain-containing protein [Anaerolineales bacterium]
MNEQKTAALVNVDKNERALSAAGGALLLISGLLRLPLAAVALLAGGAYLLYRGITGHCWGYEWLGINRAVALPRPRRDA